MANFGRKLWAWKHSLKGASNTEMVPDVISLPKDKQKWNSGLTKIIQPPAGASYGPGYVPEYTYWNSGAGYNTEDEKSFLFAKVSSTLGTGSTRGSYVDINVAKNLSFANAASDHQYDTSVSFDVQNDFSDPYSQSQYIKSDLYSTLAVSGITPDSPLDIDFSEVFSGWTNVNWGYSFVGFSPIFGWKGSNTAESGQDRSYYNNFKTVAGTTSLQASYEISQIKNTESHYNWNEIYGGDPEYDLYGLYTYGNPQEYITYTGQPPVANQTNANNAYLDYVYAGKTVKATTQSQGLYATYATGLPRPDETKIVDIAFEIELALQRYGCDYHYAEFYDSNGDILTGSLNGKGWPKLSYVAGHFCFSRGQSTFSNGNYVLVPVYMKTIHLGTKYLDYSSNIDEKQSQSITGRGRPYRYVVVAIRLGKRYNIGSFIPGSGVVFDLNEYKNSIKENYPAVLGYDRGVGNQPRLSGSDSPSGYTATSTYHNSPQKHARVRRNAKFFGSTASLNGDINPVTCFRVSENGKFGFFSGGAVYEGLSTGPEPLLPSYSYSGNFQFNNTGSKGFYSNRDRYNAKTITEVEFSENYDTGTVTSSTNYQLNLIDGNIYEVYCFTFDTLGKRLWVVYRDYFSAYFITEIHLSTGFDLSTMTFNLSMPLYNTSVSPAINITKPMSIVWISKSATESRLWLLQGIGPTPDRNTIFQFNLTGVDVYEQTLSGVSTYSTKLSLYNYIPYNKLQEASAMYLRNRGTTYNTYELNISYKEEGPSYSVNSAGGQYGKIARFLLKDYQVGTDSSTTSPNPQYEITNLEIPLLYDRDRNPYRSLQNLGNSWTEFGEGQFNGDFAAFKSRIACSKTSIVAGEPSLNTPSPGGNRAGVANVYVKNSGEYDPDVFDGPLSDYFINGRDALRYTLQHPTQKVSARFGWAVDIDEEYVVVSAITDTQTVGSTTYANGAVHIYAAETGNFLLTITPPTFDQYNIGFGYDLRLRSGIGSDKTYLMISQYPDFGTGGQLYENKIFMYEITGDPAVSITATLLWTKTNPDGTRTTKGYNYFGYAIDASPYECVASGGSNGFYESVYTGKVYHYDNATGNLLTTITNPDLTVPGNPNYNHYYSKFGYGLSIRTFGAYNDHRTVIAIGAPNWGTLRNINNFITYSGIGRIYVYRADQTSISPQSGLQYNIDYPRAITDTKDLYFGEQIHYSADGEQLLTSAWAKVQPNYTSNSGEIFVFGTPTRGGSSYYYTVMDPPKLIGYMPNPTGYNNNYQFGRCMAVDHIQGKNSFHATTGTAAAYTGNKMSDSFVVGITNGPYNGAQRGLYFKSSFVPSVNIDKLDPNSLGANNTLFSLEVNGTGNYIFIQSEGLVSGIIPIKSYTLSTNHDVTTAQITYIEQTSTKISRFHAERGSEYPGGEYFWHVTKDESIPADAPINFPTQEARTTRDPFPSGGLSSVIQTVDFNTSNFVYAPGYDEVNYPRHDVTGAFIRSFRFSNDGKYLYILWVTATRVVNNGENTIEQWVERWFIQHPEGYCGDTYLFRTDSAWYIPSDTGLGGQQPTNGLRFAGTTDKYVLTGDSSGGYLNSATAIDVTPDGKHLQVLMPLTRLYSGQQENNKPMMVEHYLGGNDLSTRSLIEGDRGVDANPTSPYMSMSWWSSGSNIIDPESTWHWPQVPVQPGKIRRTSVDTNADYGNGGSKIWTVFDRTYYSGRSDWKNDANGDDYAYPTRVIAATNYDIMPSDFSWNREGTILYLYGAYPANNATSAAGGYRRRGQPYVLTCPIYKGQNYYNSGQDPNDTSYGSTGLLYTYLNTHRISAFLDRKDQMYPDKNYKEATTESYVKTYHSSYFYPNDNAITGSREPTVVIKVTVQQDADGFNCWAFDGNIVSEGAIGPTTGSTFFQFKKSWVDLTGSMFFWDFAPYDGIMLYIFDFEGVNFPVGGEPEIEDYASSGVSPINVLYSSSTAFQNGQGWIAFQCNNSTNPPNSGLTMLSASGLNCKRARMYWRAPDFLELCAKSISYERVTGIPYGTDQYLHNTWLYNAQPLPWGAMTRLFDVPSANTNPTTNSYGYPAFITGSMNLYETDCSFRNSHTTWTNWSAAFQPNIISPGSKEIPKTFGMASVFAHHAGGKYLYTVVEDPIGYSLNQRDSDPNDGLSEIFRPQVLAILPIQEKASENFGNNYNVGYDEYWGQPDSPNVYYKYENWGAVLVDGAVSGPQMPKSALGSSRSTSIQPDLRTWGGIYLNSDDAYLHLNYFSSKRYGAITRLQSPRIDNDGMLYEPTDAMGIDSYTLSSKSLMMYPYAYKTFMSHGSDIDINLQATSLASSGEVAQNPIYSFSYQNVNYYAFKDIKGGKFGIYYGWGPGVQDVEIQDTMTWGINDNYGISGAANPFRNANFINSHWGDPDDVYDMPKFVYSKPNLVSTPSYTTPPYYFHFMQRESAVGNTGLSDLAKSKGDYYITNQKIYNPYALSKAAVAYVDYREKYSPGVDAFIDPLPNGVVPAATSADRLIIYGSGQTAIPNNAEVAYRDPRVIANDEYLDKDGAILKSFRFANNGYKLITLISGTVSSLNGISFGAPGFSLTKYELQKPYDITSSVSSETKSFTFIQDRNTSGAYYVSWWNSTNLAHSHLGCDFCLNEDGTKIWVIGTDSSKSSTPGFPSYTYESRVLVREYNLATPWDVSTISDNGFATYDTHSSLSAFGAIEVPRSIEIDPSGNYVYWSQQYGSSTTQKSISTNDWSAPYTGDFSGSQVGKDRLRHFKVELQSAFDVKNYVDSPDNKVTENVIPQGGGPILRTTRGAYWTADEGAAVRIRFTGPKRWYRSNYASGLTRNDSNIISQFNYSSDTDYFKEPVMNWPIGGFSSYTAPDEGHKTQKVDGSFSIGNMGMFKNLVSETFYPARRNIAPYDMFIFEINNEENVALVSDGQLRIVPLLLNNSTKGY